jgi:hypothetical protein
MFRISSSDIPITGVSTCIGYIGRNKLQTVETSDAHVVRSYAGHNEGLPIIENAYDGIIPEVKVKEGMRTISNYR